MLAGHVVNRSMPLPIADIHTDIKLVDPTEMRKTDSFGETGHALHVPSSS